jgi:tetraacyldisaccharide 4'-kinase
MKAVKWSALHEKRERNLTTFLLSPLSFLYGLAITLRLLAYKRGLLKSKSLPAFVVSIGNLTAGGTGKTPFVAMIAKWAVTNGFRTAILSRGYKGKKSGEALVVSDGHTILATVDEAGDEPILLAKKFPSIPVLVSKNRYRIGALALRLFNSDLLLLDDGYQHLSLHRDLNILLLDSKRRFGNRSLLPLGPLREPLEQMARADLIVISRCTKMHPGDELAVFLRKHFPGKLIFQSSHLPDQVIFPFIGKAYPPAILSGKNVVAFAGLANPDDFLEMVVGLGAHVTHFSAFSDHHTFNKEEIDEFLSWNAKPDVDFLLTTEKDLVRINGMIDDKLNLAVLTIKIGILSESNTFFDIIKNGVLRYIKKDVIG